MSVDLVTRMLSDEASDQAPDGKTFTQGRREKYQVTVTSPSDTPTTVLSDPRVPQVRSPHPDGLYLRVSGRNARKVSPILYEADIDYTSPSKPGRSPLDEPPKIHFGSVPTEEEIDTDIKGKPIIMITGEEFDPKPKETIYDPLVTVQRNVVWVNPDTIAKYRNATNSDTWYGMPPGTVRIINLDADSQSDDEFQYWTVKGEFLIRKGVHVPDSKAWWLRLRAQGYLIHVVAPIAANIHAVDDMGNRVTKPVLHRVSDGTIIEENANAEWYTFQTKPSLSFAFLGLI